MSTKGFLRGAALGALFASVATLLLAPKTGKKTRADATKLATTLSKKIHKELESGGLMSKDRYDEIVTRSLHEYARGKKITAALIGDVSKIFKSHFAEVQKELVDSVVEHAVPPKKKKSSKK